MSYLQIIEKISFQRIKPNSIAIFHSNDEFPRNGDQTFLFKQNADFFYLQASTRSKVY